MNSAYFPKYFRKCRDSYDMQAKNNGNNLQLSKEEYKKDKRRAFLKVRYMAVCMGFMGEFFLYLHRITMSVGIVAMVSNSAVLNESKFSTTKSCLNLVENSSINQINEYVSGEFLWSPEIQGYILGCSSLCYIIALPFLSIIVEIYGAKKILFCCIFFPSLFTFLSPFAARWSVYALIAVQILRGICQGGILSAAAVLIANWCPKQERGCSFTIVCCGSSVGSVIGSYLTGVLCESTILGGWPSAFFVNGTFGFIVSIIIFFFLYDNPSVHPRISPAELEYILSNQENVLTEKRPKTPWKSMFTSIPVYALSYAYFGQMWAMSHFLTVNPTFLKTILHYSIEQDGLFNALPFLLQIFTSQISGILSAVLTNNNCISIDSARKFWTLLSSFGYSACILGIYFAGCNRTLSTVLSIAALSFVGFSFAGCWIVATDMSPTFADDKYLNFILTCIFLFFNLMEFMHLTSLARAGGMNVVWYQASIEAIACSVGSLSHFLVPVTVGYITNASQTIEQWHKIFMICITIVLSSGVIFCIFGSAEIQPWNDVLEDDTQQEKQKTDARFEK